MAWRGLYLSNPAKLILKDNQLVVKLEEENVSLPIEDIAFIVLDTPQLTITSALLSACVTQDVALLVVDGKHHPAGVLLPFHQHHRQADIAHKQIAMTVPLKKRLWQALVVAKVLNQSVILEPVHHEKAIEIRRLAKIVNSGDPENIEAQAARLYWGGLFEKFRRSDERDRRNALLNYGYAVLRAGLARACVMSGFLPAFGVHHSSKTNGFNLVDDLIEPFRPFVDAWVQERLHVADMPEGEGELLDTEDKRHMASVMIQDVLLEKETMSLLAATEMVCDSLRRAVENSDASLLIVPRIPKGRFSRGV